MLKHEHFEELGAAASIGQASGAELAELREHLAFCSECQQCYSEFLQINAQQFARSMKDDEELAREEAVSMVDSTLFRERFLKKAAAEGIVFSAMNSDRPLPEPRVHLHRTLNRPLLFAPAVAALALFAAVGVGGYYLGTHRVGLSHVSAGSIALSHVDAVDEQRETAIAGLQQQNRSLTNEIASLKTSLGSASSKLSELEWNGSGNDQGQYNVNGQRG